MSTLTFIDTTDLTAGVTLTDTVTLLHFWSNPAAVRELIYGDRVIVNASPAHDHDQDGGESLLPPIVSDSFGTYYQNLAGVGIPVGPPIAGSFAETTTDGITDKTTAKRLKCWGAVIPGGVKALRVSLIEYHESASLATSYAVTVRSLHSVNHKRGVAPEECSVSLAYTTAGATATVNQSAELLDLSLLGDPTLDREVEIALWLTSDVSATEEQRVLDIEVVPLLLTASARKKNNNDLLFPSVSIREIKAGVGVVSKQLAEKIKLISNGLNVSAWGSTPGLLPNLQPDRRRRYRETISAAHTHEGSFCPTSTPGEVVGKGACLKDAQSFGYVSYLGETLPLVAATPPTMSSWPSKGMPLHKQPDTSADWVQYNFRRSIPVGCGALRMRVGVHAGYTFAARSYDRSGTLLMSITVTPVAGGSDIVTQLRCGQYASPIDSRDPDYGFVELEPENDGFHVTNRALVTAGLKGWNHGAERTPTELALLQANEILYRVSKPIEVQLTYPPARPFDTYHPTQDYNVKCRFLMRNDADVLDSQAGCLWILCHTAKGY